MSDSPRYLKSLASHFVLRDWQYCCECGETEPLT